MCDFYSPTFFYTVKPIILQQREEPCILIIEAHIILDIAIGIVLLALLSQRPIELVAYCNNKCKNIMTSIEHNKINKLKFIVVLLKKCAPRCKM